MTSTSGSDIFFGPQFSVVLKEKAMATQGLVTVNQGGSVIMKVIAGTDGMNVDRLTAIIRRSWPMTAEEVYAAARLIPFGSERCLVVMTSSDFVFNGDELEGLEDLYRASFDNPGFNPRWVSGECEYFELVAL